MGSYARVARRFWHDEKVKHMSEDARHLALYLMSSPHGNMVGVYVLPVPYACSDLGWTPQRFEKALAELLAPECHFIERDPHTDLLWVVNYLVHNPIENENQAKGAVKQLRELPRSPIFAALLRYIEPFSKPFMQPLLQQLRQQMPKPVSVSVTVTEPVAGGGDPPSVPPTGAAGARQGPGEADGPNPTTPAGPGPEQRVMDHYNQEFRGLWKRPLQLTPDRKVKIRARLGRFSEAELCQAITNIRASPFHCGENDRGQVYATPEFIFRNDGTVDKWLNTAPVARPAAAGGVLGGRDPPRGRGLSAADLLKIAREGVPDGDRG